MRSYETQFAVLTRSTAARVHREGRIALAHLHVIAIGSGLESCSAAHNGHGGRGECSEKASRLHRVDGSFNPVLLSSLYVLLGSYGDRTNLGPAKHHRIRTADYNKHRG